MRKLTFKFTMLLAWIISIMLYIIAPPSYDHFYVSICGLFFLLEIILFYFIHKPRNLFNFDTLFILSIYFICFHYPIFIYTVDPYSLPFFSIPYDENVISKATGMALMGISTYLYFRSNIVQSTKLYVKSLSDGVSYCFLSMIFFVFYIILGGYSSLAALYTGITVEASSLANYLGLFSNILMFIGIIFNFIYNYNSGKFSVFLKSYPCIYALCISALYLLAGSRTIPLQIVLIVVFWYGSYFKNFSLLKFFLSVSIGVVFMFLISVIRIGGEFELNSDFLNSVTMDLVINNRNSFVAVDYVNTHGLSYGMTMLSPLLGAIPFLQSIFFEVLNIDPNTASSSLIITHESLTTSSRLGLGTNIFADIYMAFGGCGVVFFMYVFSKFISFIEKHTNTNVYCFMAYSVMMSYAVFLARAEFFFPTRILVALSLFIFIQKKISRS